MTATIKPIEKGQITGNVDCQKQSPDPNPPVDCGNVDHYDTSMHCPHCDEPICADWENCLDGGHDVPNCPAGQ